jgi:putative endonuclease
MKPSKTEKARWWEIRIVRLPIFEDNTFGFEFQGAYRVADLKTKWFRCIIFLTVRFCKKEKTMQPNYTYILRCADGSLYTGWTTDLEGRLRAHNSGKGAKYTRSRLPVEIVYFETFETKSEAMSREWHLKRLSRAEKLALIKEKG